MNGGRKSRGYHSHSQKVLSRPFVESQSIRHLEWQGQLHRPHLMEAEIHCRETRPALSGFCCVVNLSEV